MGMSWEFNLNFDQIAERVHAGLKPAALLAMEAIVRPEVARQTPVETGHLVGSEEVRPIDDGVEIFIPGPYARRQHYELSYRHNTGNALYLELPMVSKAPDVIRFLGDEFRKLL
jgi:hypothetical protein